MSGKKVAGRLVAGLAAGAIALAALTPAAASANDAQIEPRVAFVEVVNTWEQYNCDTTSAHYREVPLSYIRLAIPNGTYRLDYRRVIGHRRGNYCKFDATHTAAVTTWQNIWDTN